MVSTINHRYLFKRALQIITVFCITAILYSLLLYHPEQVFPFAVNDHNLTLRADLAFSQEGAISILRLVHEKLCKSPFYTKEEQYQICICQTGWRKRLFFTFYQKAGGLCYPGSYIVYLSGADFMSNRLIAPSGKPVMDERTLDYFIAHELTHAMVGADIGIFRFQALPEWIKEGYADYIGRGGVFLRPGARQAYLTDATEMTTPVIAPYLRYNFLVSFLLDKLKWTPFRLHNNPIPQSVIELQIRKSLL